MKYVLVTGGVVSGLGKGVTASSIGVLLKACGKRVTSIKIGALLPVTTPTPTPTPTRPSPLLSRNRTTRIVLDPRVAVSLQVQSHTEDPQFHGAQHGPPGCIQHPSSVTHTTKAIS